MIQMMEILKMRQTKKETSEAQEPIRITVKIRMMTYRLQEDRPAYR
jgi:hypothetical protein